MDCRFFEHAHICVNTVRESALTVVTGRKIPCPTGESNLGQRRAGPVLYQLSYIPTCGTSIIEVEEKLGFVC